MQNPNSSDPNSVGSNPEPVNTPPTMSDTTPIEPVSTPVSPSVGEDTLVSADTTFQSTAAGIPPANPVMEETTPDLTTPSDSTEQAPQTKGNKHIIEIIVLIVIIVILVGLGAWYYMSM